MAVGVLVDANVLYSRTLRDWLFLLRNASNGDIFTVYATEDVIAEVLYRLRRNNPQAPGGLIARVHDRIVESIDDRVTDYDIDPDFPGTDPDDAHVHSAAVASGAGILLSADGGFAQHEAAVLDQLPYEVHTPDSLFVLVDDVAPDVVGHVAAEQAAYWADRGSTPEELVQHLRAAGCPEFARRLELRLSELSDLVGGPEQAPLPLMTSSIEDAMAAHFPEGEPTPDSPLRAAMLWWLGLQDPAEYRNALDALSLDPDAWGDYREAASLIGDLAVMTVVEPCPEDPNIQHVKFIDYAGDHVAVAFEEAPLSNFYALTMVLPPGSEWWRVWGLARNRFPTADEVRGPSEG